MSAQVLLTTASNDRHRLASRINSSAERMTRMIDQLLDLTRIRLGKGIAIGPKSVSLGELTRKLAEETQSAHQRAVEVEEGGNTSGIWDADRLSQVLSNLLTNAVVHGKSESRIILRLDGYDPANMHLEIRNEGLIPNDILPVIFEPFRGDSPHRGDQGLGLGLFITREIVQAHGGQIHAICEQGVTAFKIDLPRVTQVAEQRSRES